MLHRREIIMLAGVIALLLLMAAVGATLKLANAPELPPDTLQLPPPINQYTVNDTPPAPRPVVEPAAADKDVYSVSGPNGVIVDIEPYGEQVYLPTSERNVYRHRLKISQNNELISDFDLVTNEIDASTWDVATSSFRFSPSGRYLVFGTYAWESGLKFLVDTHTGKNVTPPDLCWFDMFWISDEKAVVVSYYCAMDGTGTPALYLWNAADPTHLTLLHTFEHIAPVSDVSLSPDKSKLLLTVDEQRFEYNISERRLDPLN